MAGIKQQSESKTNPILKTTKKLANNQNPLQQPSIQTKLTTNKSKSTIYKSPRK